MGGGGASSRGKGGFDTSGNPDRWRKKRKSRKELPTHQELRIATLDLHVDRLELKEECCKYMGNDIRKTSFGSK